MPTAVERRLAGLQRLIESAPRRCQGPLDSDDTWIRFRGAGQVANVHRCAPHRRALGQPGNLRRRVDRRALPQSRPKPPRGDKPGQRDGAISAVICTYVHYLHRLRLVKGPSGVFCRRSRRRRAARPPSIDVPQLLARQRLHRDLHDLLRRVLPWQCAAEQATALAI